MTSKDDLDILINELATNDREIALRVQVALERRELARQSSSAEPNRRSDAWKVD